MTLIKRSIKIVYPAFSSRNYTRPNKKDNYNFIPTWPFYLMQLKVYVEKTNKKQ